MVYNLPDDVLIYTVAFLSVPDILHLRQTCKRFNALTRLSIVWTNAFKLEILANGYPFSPDYTDLEHRTRHAHRLASRWLADAPLTPKRGINFTGSSSSISKIKFIPGRQIQWMLTVSTMPSVLTIWDITQADKCSERSWDDTLITALELNTDPMSEASIAVLLGGVERVVLLHLDDDGTLHEIHSINTDLRPVNLTGDLIALSDDVSKTVICNWKTDTRTNLDDLNNTHSNHCFQVVFAPSTILVVRMFSIHMYAFPPLLGDTHTPIATHRFSDWVSSVSVPFSAPNNAFSILIHSQDPHLAFGTKFMALYNIPLNTNPSYTFPLRLVSIMSSNNHIRLYYCTHLVLGKCATGVWARLPDRNNGCVALMTAVFHGPLNPTGEIRVHEVPNTSDHWASLDYDEERGRIALGSMSGKIRILYL